MVRKLLDYLGWENEYKLMLAITSAKAAVGCGITDYLMTGEMRDFCDMWIVCGGIFLILLLILIKKNLVERGNKDSAKNSLPLP
jgi:hypothetical protein